MSPRIHSITPLRWLPPAPRLGLIAITAMLLSGCASLGLSSPSSTAPASDTALAAVAENATYRLEIEAPSDLRTLLATYLDLARFQAASGDEGVTGLELDRLVALAPAQARALLETEGYFNAEVSVERVVGTPPLLRVLVTPGPGTRVASVKLLVQGPLQAAAVAGDEAARHRLRALEEKWALKNGAAWRQSAWRDAKNETLARLHADGYPAATLALGQAKIDTAAQHARLKVVIDSGPLFYLGELKVEGLQRYDEQVVRRLADFAPGTPYTDQRLTEYQDRLRKVGLFESVSAEIDTDPARASASTVSVRLRELPLQQATVGVGISANTGPRTSLEHLHRRVFGWNWGVKSKIELGRDLRSLETELTSHPQAGNYRNLLAAGGERLATTDEVRTSQRFRIGRARETQRIEHLYYAELTRSRLFTQPTGTATTGDAASLNYHWIWRQLDNALLPTDGITASAQLAGGFARASDADNGPFGRTLGRLTWYRPFGSNWYGVTRVEAGQVFAADRVGLPDTLLFRAGGDDSVRGYGYRGLGPQKAGALGSGRVLLTGSAEVARPISPELPAFWWAAFVDAGNAADHWDELSLAVGYGLGLRWRSPVGPLRLDLAYGQDVRRLRLHLSVGIAF